MNVLEFSQIELQIGKADHVFIHGVSTNGVLGTAQILVDTGFSLGFAFDISLMNNFGFKEGFLSNVVLADATIIKAYTFFADIIIPHNGESRNLGIASVIFIKGGHEPVAGIELLKLMSPLYIDWKNNSVRWAEQIFT